MNFYFMIAPFVLQGICMFVDEFYYHHKRGLPPWEIWGHPVDTLCFLGCFLYLNHFEASLDHLYVYLALALLSCLVVTKDEFVHSKLCSSGEMWLHSVLFVLHPLALGSAGALWWYASEFSGAVSFLTVQSYLIMGFMAYQILYWSVPWKRLVRLTTASTTR